MFITGFYFASIPDLFLSLHTEQKLQKQWLLQKIFLLCLALETRL